MHLNLQKKLQKIYNEFNNLNILTKKALKNGIKVFLLVLAVGTAVLLFNNHILSYNFYTNFLANSIIKNSFIILAEIIIGCLIVDYIFKRDM